MYAKTILIATLLACGAYASASPPPDEGKAPAEPAAAPTAGSTTPATATSAAPTSAATTNAAASPATPAAASGSSPQAPATEDGKSKKKKGKKELDPMTADLAELREAGYKIVKQENGDELLCRREPEPGSRVKMRTLCYTRAELKEMSLANRNEMLKMKAHGADGGG